MINKKEILEQKNEDTLLIKIIKNILILALA